MSHDSTEQLWPPCSESLLEWDEAFHGLMRDDRLRMIEIQPGDRLDLSLSRRYPAGHGPFRQIYGWRGRVLQKVPVEIATELAAFMVVDVDARLAAKAACLSIPALPNMPRS